MKKMKSLKDTLPLLNGREIPCVGFGTYLMPDGKTAVEAVTEALRLGYRHIDTASYYKNEQSIGNAVRESGVERKELFVTSKLWNSDQGYDTTLRAFDRSLSALGFEYLDLYLIHWPIARGHQNDWQRMVAETWRAMERLYVDGVVKAIGVSNFKPHHLDVLLDSARELPTVNQIELFPGITQRETVDYCRARGIVVEAWSPFGRGKVFQVPELQNLAASYGKTVSQIVLRWHLQSGHVPLPKSATASRIVENAELFDFELSPADMSQLNHLRIPGVEAADSDRIAY